MPGTTLLTALSISETSLVDAPANDLPGWLVMKGAKRGTLKKAQTLFRKALIEIRDSDQPDEVKAAAIPLLIEEMEKELGPVAHAIITPVAEEMALEQSIIEQYGITKERHAARHPGSGKFIPRAQAVQPKPAHKRSLLPWRHSGAPIPHLAAACERGEIPKPCGTTPGIA